MAAVVVVALVAGGLFVVAGGGPGDRRGAAGGTGGSKGDGGATKAAPVRLTVTPENRATRVALDAKARVVAEEGRLRAVRVTGAGRRLDGKLAADGRSWVSTGALAPATRYRVVAEAADDAGAPTRRQSSFTTLRPRAELRASVMPPRRRDGRGRPAHRRLVQRAGGRPGRGRTAPRGQLLQAGHRGLALVRRQRGPLPPQGLLAEPGPRSPCGPASPGPTPASGVWGVADRTIRFSVGERRVSVVDVRTHRMKVTSGGRTLRVLPVSTGRERYPTTNGVHFVLEKNQVKVMDSSTVGIPRNGPGGYYQRVAWSVRISNSGEFVHAAPWSTGSQGSANVSHGCVNLSTANAAWFFGQTRRGDVVEVRGSPKRPGSSFGVADWNMSWSRWLAGSALPR